MAKPKNVVVVQSGGPSPVINNSLRGVIETCLAIPAHFRTVYAGYHGIEGVLREELLNLSAQDPEEIALLRTTPAAGAIGTCRYKLKAGQQEDFERIVEVFKAHDVGYFFCSAATTRWTQPTRWRSWPTSGGWSWCPLACLRRLTTMWGTAWMEKTN
jgi:hypothetical protein